MNVLRLQSSDDCLFLVWCLISQREGKERVQQNGRYGNLLFGFPLSQNPMPHVHYLEPALSDSALLWLRRFSRSPFPSQRHATSLQLVVIVIQRETAVAQSPNTRDTSCPQPVILISFQRQELLHLFNMVVAFKKKLVTKVVGMSLWCAGFSVASLVSTQ